MADHTDLSVNITGIMSDVKHPLHNRYTRLMEPIHDPSRRDAHSAHKKSRAFIDNNIHKLSQTSVRVVFVGLSRVSANLGYEEIDTPTVPWGRGGGISGRV